MGVRIPEVHEAETRFLAMDSQMSVEKHNVKTAVHFAIDERIVKVLIEGRTTVAGGFVNDSVHGCSSEN
jgi:hypothetical protein